MRAGTYITFLLFLPHFLSGQTIELSQNLMPKHYLSFNPLNILLFQQIGLTYEYKPNKIGYGITAGYIYPNKKEYSNYFIAGPTNFGSLGYYSGLFIVPQVNLYLRMPKNKKTGGLVYLAFKGVYKYMHIDSTGRYAWDTHSDDYYWVYRQQLDNVNILGAFIDFGYKCVIWHFFFDINVGPGIIFINHRMIIVGEATGPYPIHILDQPRKETLNQIYPTVNFTLNFGVAF
jgi:hypothetical protein